MAASPSTSVDIRTGCGSDPRPSRRDRTIRRVCRHNRRRRRRGVRRPSAAPTRSSASSIAFRPQIEALEGTIRSIEARIHAPEFYREPSSAISQTMSDLEARQADLLQAYARWEELERKE